MQTRISLLARLGAASEVRVSPVKTLRDDVLEQLKLICQTRIGSSPSAPTLGLPDLTDVLHGGGDTPGLIVRALKRAIEAHEPRLSSVRISHVPGEGPEHVLRFEIRGEIVQGRQRSPVQFETRIDPSRRVQVR